MKNVKEVAEKIKSIQSQNNRKATKYVNIVEDNYKKYLAKGKSHYERKMTGNMKKIKATIKFKDMKHGNMLRYVGDEFIEDDARAKDLIERGFAVLIADLNEKKVEVEQAVKEEKKEKAVKEKAVKRNAKK